jgi:hypothetical protein
MKETQSTLRIFVRNLFVCGHLEDQEGDERIGLRLILGEQVVGIGDGWI